MSNRMPSDTTRLSREERAELLDLYEGLRVADVTDGLDYNGFHESGQMKNGIKPLYRDEETFSHRFIGFAHTIRYHPTNKRRELPEPDEMQLDFEEVPAWAGQWWGEHVPGPSNIREGDAVIVEAHDIEVGIIGSMNGLEMVTEGAVGVVTNGGPRDTDEVIKQDIPMYGADVNKPIPPGRVEFDAEQVPVNVGGTKVEPDDIVVADGDGVVVVPLEHAENVAKAARQVQVADQQARREYYEEVGLEPDFTLEQPESR